jgi:predicted ribosomally synthesized peptide with nif11-like leader
MSIESLQEFGRKVQLDRELYEKLMYARALATVKVAADAGFTFTVEEAKALVDEVSAELADEQLEAVAGGLVGMPLPPRTKPDE